MKKITIKALIMVPCFSILALLGIREGTAGNSNTKQYTVTKVWSTKKELRVPESVLFDKTENILYVSNINGKPMEKNGRGFISKISLAGRIEVLKWVTGLHAPKGLARYQDMLYVSDIDRLVRIGIKTGTIRAEYPAAGARFLNDVAADASGNVYVTDMSPDNSVIYVLRQGTMAVWMERTEIRRPNGLDIEGNNLFVGNSGDGSLKKINVIDKTITTIAKVGSGIDGLRSDGKGNFFISDWSGKTSLVTASGTIITLIDTTDMKINSADLEYMHHRNLLLIPTFFDNRVVAYTVEAMP